MFYVYFLRSINHPNQVYTGSTDNLEIRLEQHNNGTSTHTNKFRPWCIEAYVMCDSRETAEIVEAYFKNSSGKEKFANFTAANPLHPNSKQGFLDTLEDGRGFGSKERRFTATKVNKQTMFTMNRVI